MLLPAMERGRPGGRLALRLAWPPASGAGKYGRCGSPCRSRAIRQTQRSQVASIYDVSSICRRLNLSTADVQPESLPKGRFVKVEEGSIGVGKARLFIAGNGKSLVKYCAELVKLLSQYKLASRSLDLLFPPSLLMTLLPAPATSVR